MDKIFGIIVTTLGTLKLKPGFDEETSDEILFGRKVEILEILDNHWFFVETECGYRGYIHGMSLYLEEGLEEWDRTANHMIDWNVVDTLKAPKYQSNRGIVITRGAIVKLTGREEGEWLEIETPTGENYWLRREFVCHRIDENTLAENELRDSLVDTAIKYLGSQYRWGGKTPMGIDCSGLTNIVYLLHGIKIYRDASIEKGYPIKEIDRSDMKKGDLLYWKGHVAMYIGDDEYIHSTGYSSGVVINSLNPRDENYREDLKDIDKVGSIF